MNTCTSAAYRLCLITFREIWNGVLLIPLISPRRVVIASRSLYYVNTVRLIKLRVIFSRALFHADTARIGRGCTVKDRFFRLIRKNSAAKRFRVISRWKSRAARLNDSDAYNCWHTVLLVSLDRRYLREVVRLLNFQRHRVPTKWQDITGRFIRSILQVLYERYEKSTWRSRRIGLS